MFRSEVEPERATFRTILGGDKGPEINAAEWPQAFKEDLRLALVMSQEVLFFRRSSSKAVKSQCISLLTPLVE